VSEYCHSGFDPESKNLLESGKDAETSLPCRQAGSA